MSHGKRSFYLCLALVLAVAGTCAADRCDSLKEPYEKARCYNDNRQYMPRNIGSDARAQEQRRSNAETRAGDFEP